MKKLLVFVGLLCMAMGSYAQINFEQGYIISNTNDSIPCLIKNMGWNNNPTEFKYQIAGETEVKTAGIADVSEFGIGTSLRFVKRTVAIDRSSNDNSKLSKERRPEYQTETLFLKVLVTGKAHLYSYKGKTIMRYFYQKEGEEIQQLIHKLYVIEINKIRENNNFRNQLWNNLQCGDVTINQLKRVQYRQKDLVNYIQNYNECVGGNTIAFFPIAKEKKDAFHLSIRPGVKFASYSITSIVPGAEYKTKFDDKTTFRIGVELAYTLPINKNKWNLFIEPTYQYYESEGRDEQGRQASIDYQSIEVPLGVRYNFFLSNKSKLFVNTAYVIDINKKGRILHENMFRLDIKTRNNIAFGAGYTYNKKYTAEVRYEPRRDLINGYMGARSKYQTFSIILGYTLF